MGQLLQEVNQFDYVVEELNEDGNPKKFRLKGVYQASDVPNGNGRMYPRPVLEGAVTSVQETVGGRRMLGELDHPSDAKIHLDKVSHIITKLEMTDNGQVYGEAEVLPTASGKILESLLKSGVKLGVSSRGFGSTKKNNQGLDEVQNDYKLVTFDIVSDPSTPGAFPQAVYEHKEQQQPTKVDESELVADLGSIIDDVLDEDVEVEQESKQFVCTDSKGTRFYIVEGDHDSYGFLNFHISHDYHLLAKSNYDDDQERIGLSESNLETIERLYGDKVLDKILSTIDELGYEPNGLTRKKEDY